jgi:hypothetical protein
MAWKGKKKEGIWKKGADPTIDFLDLLPLLLRTKTQQSDQPLYQLLKDLITKTSDNKDQVNTILNSFFGRVRITDDTDLSAILTIISTINNILTNATFITEADETLLLTASRQAIAGTNITFDVTNPGQIILNASGAGGSGVMYMPLTDGNRDETQDIYALGDHIMVAVPIT